MAITKEELILHVRTAKEKILQFQRFSLLFKLVLLAPALGWFAAFNLSKYIPADIRPKIDTTTLPYLEGRVLFGYSLQHWPRNLLEGEDRYVPLIYFLDLLSAFVYVIHFCFVWFFAIGIYVYYRKRTDQNGKPIINPWTFFWCWGWLNFLSVMTQLCWPTSPPWYNEMYGNKPPNYGMHGDPAGLENADQILHIPLFGSLYGQSPIVFGSFPSLHGAWPIMITIFTPTRKIFKVLGTVYASLVWWAAMYLNHHYLTDLLGGLLMVIVCYMGGMLLLRAILDKLQDRIYSRGGLAIVRINSQDKLQDLELVMVETHDEDEIENPTVDLDEIVINRPSMKKSRSRDLLETAAQKEQTIVHPPQMVTTNPPVNIVDLEPTLMSIPATPDSKRKEL